MKHILEPCERAFVKYFARCGNRLGLSTCAAIAKEMLLGKWDDEANCTAHYDLWDAFKAGWQANDDNRAPKKKAKKGVGA